MNFWPSFITSFNNSHPFSSLISKLPPQNQSISNFTDKPKQISDDIDNITEINIKQNQISKLSATIQKQSNYIQCLWKQIQEANKVFFQTTTALQSQIQELRQQIQLQKQIIQYQRMLYKRQMEMSDKQIQNNLKQFHEADGIICKLLKGEQNIFPSISINQLQKQLQHHPQYSLNIKQFNDKSQKVNNQKNNNYQPTNKPAQQEQMISI